jgi:hypothetical protein
MNSLKVALFANHLLGLEAAKFLASQDDDQVEALY